MTKDEGWVLEEKYGGKEAPEFEADRRRLAKGEPAAYVIGHQPFLGLTIHLDSHPLIPRPETEWWTEQVLAELVEKRADLFPERAQRDGASQSKFSTENYAAPETNPLAPAFSFLDLCAGSGAIGCAALAKLPNAKVYFGEIDAAHEPTIRKNIAVNNLDATRADIRIGDLFAPFGDLTFDAIAANPPYIPRGRELEKSVADFEPVQALYAGDDGLDILRRIAAELPRRLAANGVAWIECDSAHAEEARGLFEAAGLRAEIRTDQYGAPRIVVVSFP